MGLNGILYTGPIADLLSAVIAIIMAAHEFSLMNRLEGKEKSEAAEK